MEWHLTIWIDHSCRCIALLSLAFSSFVWGAANPQSSCMPANKFRELKLETPASHSSMRTFLTTPKRVIVFYRAGKNYRHLIVYKPPRVWEISAICLWADDRVLHKNDILFSHFSEDDGWVSILVWKPIRLPFERGVAHPACRFSRGGGGGTVRFCAFLHVLCKCRPSFFSPFSRSHCMSFTHGEAEPAPRRTPAADYTCVDWGIGDRGVMWWGLNVVWMVMNPQN